MDIHSDVVGSAVFIVHHNFNFLPLFSLLTIESQRYNPHFLRPSISTLDYPLIAATRFIARPRNSQVEEV